MVGIDVTWKGVLEDAIDTGAARWQVLGVLWNGPHARNKHGLLDRNHHHHRSSLSKKKFRREKAMYASLFISFEAGCWTGPLLYIAMA